MMLSKSEYMLYLRHPAWLWIKKHAKHLMPPIDEALQARFDEGNAFEPFVESLFPDLMRVGFESYSEYLDMPEKTTEAWKNGAEVVSQGRYEHGSITCISDLVRRDGDDFILTEIKSSTSAKTDHALDLAFQKIVLEGAGLPVKRCEVAHVNNSYIRNGDIDPRQIVSFADITTEVENLLEGTKSRIDQALIVSRSHDMPDPAPERARLKSYKDWLVIRQNISPPLPENSIYFLPYMDAEYSSKLIEMGISKEDEIRDLTVLKKSTRKYLTAKAEGVRSVDKDRLATFLSDISYPIHFFDYEASQSLLPYWDGTRPYQQIPVQYSLHIIRSPDGAIEHREYLHKDTSNPMPSLIRSLKENVEDSGSILVWSESYEKKRNNEMAESYPDEAEFLTAFNERVIDLMKPFTQDMVRDPAFMGSSSIKKVLPAMVPDFSYEGLGIQDGSAATRKWQEATFGETSAGEREKIYRDLVEYCQLDTMAMVEIHKKLLELST